MATLVEAWLTGLDGPGLGGTSDALRDANDLWAAAVSLDGRLGALRDALEAALARPVLLTGSGSTLVALYPSPKAAVDAAAAARAARRPGGGGAAGDGHQRHSVQSARTRRP